MSKKLRIFFKDRHKIRVAGILCFLLIYISAQSISFTQNGSHTNNKVSQKKKVQILKAVSLDKNSGFDYNVLMDSVILLHDGALMYCDSAYLNEKSNSFEAFSNIRVNQGDTLFLYGDYMFYDGNIKLLKVRNNVRLENRDVTLFTDSLDYDRVLNMGYYFDGGMLVDSLNELTSFWGQYEPNIRMATFSDSVKLVNNRFVLHSDTLKYNTFTKVATILGPSTILSDSGTIYSTRGWYNTQNEQSMLLDRSRIVNKERNRILVGDTILYHKLEGYGEVFGNMFLQDTAKKIILQGHYGYYNDIQQYAMATDSAWCIEYSQKDSLYLHADTLQMTSDSIFKEIKAFHGVRFYRQDIQGVCDSMQFNTRDSVLYMYKDPVLWNEGHQLYGDTIEIFMNDSTVDWVHMKRYCFVIEDKDSIHFNQLKGRDLKAYMKNGEVHYIVVEGNVESIFYPVDEKDMSLIGLNRSESSFLSMNLKDKKIEKLKLWPKATGKMTPLPDLTTEQMKLPDFQWFDYLRPLNKDDIFRKAKKKEGSVRRTSNKFTTN